MPTSVSKPPVVVAAGRVQKAFTVILILAKLLVKFALSFTVYCTVVVFPVKLAIGVKVRFPAVFTNQVPCVAMVKPFKTELVYCGLVAPEGKTKATDDATIVPLLASLSLLKIFGEGVIAVFLLVVNVSLAATGGRLMPKFKPLTPALLTTVPVSSFEVVLFVFPTTE